MKKRDIEKLIISQRDNIVPDVLKSVMEKASVPPAPAGARIKKEVNRRLRFFKFAAAICAAIAVLASGILYYDYGNSEMGTLYVDINPSFALTVNRNYTVTGITKTGDENAVSELGLIGMNADEAVLSIMDYAVSQNYIINGDSDNAVSLSTEEGAKSQDLLTRVENRIKGYFEKNGITCQIIKNTFTKEEKRQADQSQISPGKLKIINRILEIGSGYTAEELKGYTIKELNIIYQQCLNPNENGGQGTGSGNGEEHGKEENKEQQGNNDGGDNGNGQGSNGGMYQEGPRH